MSMLAAIAQGWASAEAARPTLRDCVLELPSRDAAIQWAAKIAQACRCSQELREFGYDPES